MIKINKIKKLKGIQPYKWKINHNPAQYTHHQPSDQNMNTNNLNNNQQHGIYYYGVDLKKICIKIISYKREII